MSWSLLIIAGAVYGGLCLSLFIFQSRLVYFPSRALIATPQTIGLAYQDVSLESTNGLRLHAWFIPADEARLTLLFLHGNAGNISHRLDSLRIFSRLGLSVLIFDYAGFGTSEGSPSERQSYEDAEAAWRYLTADRGVSPSQIVLFGRSLGGAVATRLATERAPAGLIIESTFSSVPDVAAQHYPFLPVRLLARIQYDALANISRIRCPILIIHSRQDELIPFSHSERLFRAANEPKFFMELEGGHNDGFLVTGAPYISALEQFIGHLAAPPAMTTSPGDG